ncbi:MAG: hypothetical protein LLG04_09370 [Parachlamydia sp.]|nr:hypothetical protein [Parachlamydia sp.]
MKLKSYIIGFISLLAVICSLQAPLMAAKKDDRKQRKHESSSSSFPSCSSHKLAPPKKENKARHASCKKRFHETKYVQAGLCEVGNGSKSHPYNSLAQAQADESWTTLIVRASPFVLDGGITLRDGQSLIGETSPVDGSLAHDQPIITNSSTASNGGNGVIVESGNVVIKNIYFKDTWASAVDYSNSENICISNVLVTGFNQGSVTVPLIYELLTTTTVLAPAFLGQLTNNGMSFFTNVAVKSGFTGDGIFELVVGANRKLIVDNYEATQLRLFNPPAAGLSNNIVGIRAGAATAGTNYKVCVKDADIHDFAPNLPRSPSNISARGVMINPTDGANVRASVKSTTFRNIFSDGTTSNSFDVVALTTTTLANVPLGVRSTINYIVENCYFEEPLQTSQNSRQGFQTQSVNSVDSGVVSKNVFNNIFNTLATFGAGNSQSTLKAIHNIATGSNTFFAANTSTLFTAPTDPINISTDVTLKDNKYTGLSGFGSAAIAVFPRIPVSWTSLVINAQNNCFDGQNVIGSVGLLGIPIGSGSTAGNATINATQNNIVNFETDILDIDANVSYIAPRNWWGRPAGATNIIVGPGAVVDVSKPLQSPIECPEFRYCPPTGQQVIIPSDDAREKTSRGTIKERVNSTAMDA